jgi:hypothetical protein
MSDNAAERNFNVELTKCIYPDCGGELYELAYDEHNNWITVVYKCSHCGREFTIKIEL